MENNIENSKILKDKEKEDIKFICDEGLFKILYNQNISKFYKKPKHSIYI